MDYYCISEIMHDKLRILYNSDLNIKGIHEIRVYPSTSVPFPLASKPSSKYNIEYLDKDNTMSNTAIIYSLLVGILASIFIFIIFSIWKTHIFNIEHKTYVNSQPSAIKSKLSQNNSALRNSQSVYTSTRLKNNTSLLIF